MEAVVASETSTEVVCVTRPNSPETLLSGKILRHAFVEVADYLASKAANSALCQLSDELLLAIFSNLLEQDLCRVSLVCKRLHSVANDKKLWKTLYKEVFEYDLVLLKGKKNQFNFHSPADLTCANPWKMSMSHMYRGLHVRPGYQDRTFSGRSVKYFNTIWKAVEHGHDMFGHNAVLVFLHAGTHPGPRLRVNCNVALIGAAPGTVVESVFLQCINSDLFFPESRPIYVGHISLQVRTIFGSFYGGTGMMDHCIFHCLEDRPERMDLNILYLQHGIQGLQMTHCVVMRPHGTKIQIPISSMDVCIGTEQPLPASCPWVQQGLDLTKYNESACIAVCQSAGEDSSEDKAG